MHYFISTAIDPKPFQKAIHKDIHKDTKSIPLSRVRDLLL